LTAVTATNGICGNAACTRSAVSMTLAPGFLNTIRRKHGCSFDSSGRLTDERVAAVLTYIRNSWGNAAATVSADEVKVIKSKLTANGG
jgi:hypothetical protein